MAGAISCLSWQAMDVNKVAGDEGRLGLISQFHEPDHTFLTTCEGRWVGQVLVKVSSLWGSTLESQNCVSLLDYLGLPLGARMVVGKKERRGKWKKLKEKARVCRLQSVHACKSAAGCEICGRSK